MKYHTDEAIFEVPDSWIDQSINIIESSGSEPSDYNVVITRDEFETGDDLESYTERQLEQLPNHFPQFQLRNRYTVTIENTQAYGIEFSWIDEAGTMNLYQIYMAYQQNPLVITATSRGVLAKENKQILNDIISSFRFRRK